MDGNEQKKQSVKQQNSLCFWATCVLSGVDGNEPKHSNSKSCPAVQQLEAPAEWMEILVAVVIGRFYAALFSALEQTHCTCT